MSNFFIPKKINVGYQERNGTYTGKLAYIIYFDAKGKLRKEKSWNGWRDEKIDNDIIENEPTSGFVLNKKAGGYDTGWNHRQTYVRVYDPRGFEFEITVPNLLYILENATSTVGKGLEGEFVYGWDGTELVLIPCNAPDYKELVKLNELRHDNKKIYAKDLKVGATYLTKDNEELIYMGKFDYHGWKAKDNEKRFFFCERYDKPNYYGNTFGFHEIKSVPSKFIDVVSEECVEDYADIFHELEGDTSYSPYDKSKDVYEPYTLEEIKERLDDRWYLYVYSHFQADEGEMKRNEIQIHGGRITYKKEVTEKRTRGYSWWSQKEEYDYTYTNSVQVESIEEAFEFLKPMKKKKYLANGRFYGEE